MRNHKSRKIIFFGQSTGQEANDTGIKRGVGDNKKAFGGTLNIFESSFGSVFLKIFSKLVLSVKNGGVLTSLKGIFGTEEPKRIHRIGKPTSGIDPGSEKKTEIETVDVTKGGARDLNKFFNTRGRISVKRIKTMNDKRAVKTGKRETVGNSAKGGQTKIGIVGEMMTEKPSQTSSSNTCGVKDEVGGREFFVGKVVVDDEEVVAIFPGFLDFVMGNDTVIDGDNKIDL